MANKNYEILDNIKIPDVNEIVKLVVDNNIDDVYQYAVSFNAHNTGRISQGELAEFIATIYSDWYYNLRDLDKERLDEETKKDIQRLFAYSKFYPSNMTGDKCLQFFFEEFEKNFSSKKIRPVFLSDIPNGETNCFIQFNTNAINGLKREKVERENKLYLNLQSRYIIRFVKILIERAADNNVDIDIKICDMDNRSDDVIIYTTYSETAKIVEIIDSIKRDFVYLFEDSYKTGLFWGVINEYIGFGEEFKGEINTYGIKRANAIQKCLDQSKVAYLKQIFLNQEKSIKVENKELTSLEFLDYIIKHICKLEVKTRLDEMKEEKDTKKEQKILQDVIDNIEKDEDNIFQEFIDNEVKRLRDCLINHKPFVMKMNLQTKDAEISVTSNYDFRSKLFDIFSTLNDKITISNYDTEEIDRIINMALYKNNSDLKLKTSKNELMTPIRYLQSIIRTSAISSLKSYLYNNDEEDKDESEDNDLNNEVKEILDALMNLTEEGKSILKDTIFSFQNQLANDENIVLKLITEREVNIVLPYNYVDIMVSVFAKSNNNKYSKSVDEKTIKKSLEQSEISVEKFIIGKQTQEELNKKAN